MSYMHVYIYTCISIYICHICMYIYMCVCMYTCIISYGGCLQNPAPIGRGFISLSHDLQCFRRILAVTDAGFRNHPQYHCTDAIYLIFATLDHPALP